MSTFGMSSSGVNIQREFDYEWGAPLEGLEIGAVNLTSPTVQVPYSFSNEGKQKMDITINSTIYDSSGTIIGFGESIETAYPGEKAEGNVSITMIGAPAPGDYAVVRATDEESGLEYERREEL